MLSRRFLRIKVLQELYAYRQTGETDLAMGERQLLTGIDKLYELFIWQVSFWVEVRRFAEFRLEENKLKHLPTEEDLNPNMRFVNNRVLRVLDENMSFLRLEESYGINWADHRNGLIRNFYYKLREMPEYKLYMSSEDDSFETDKQFILSVIDTYQSEDEILLDFFSDYNIFFNTDYQLSVLLLWKFINEMKKSFSVASPMPAMFKTENGGLNDDKDFVIRLFRKTILNGAQYDELISSGISNWEYDRIALMDVLILKMALTEFFEFPSIPVKVTINEYIEVSKFYSTPDSKRFINGLLDKMSIRLKEEGKIVKRGRGLM